MAMGRERVAYLVSWFPAVTETFILDEVRELRRRGVEVEVFPLFGARGGQVHSAWRELAGRTHYHRSASWEMVAAQLHWLRRKPGALLRAWAEALLRNAPSRKLLVRTPLVLLKGALVARRIEAMGMPHVHAHWATHPALAAWLVRALTGIDYSFTAHAHDLYVDRAMLREKVEAARFVVTISEFNRRLLAEVCGPAAAAKVHVIRCGVDSAAFAPAPRRDRGVPTFACVASLREYKGHAVLLDAVRLLRERGKSVRAVLVGDGELRGALEARIARYGLADAVELRGALPHEQIAGVLADATAMVLPSVTSRDGQMEGIPVALMEAMAAGVPVISTRLSGIPELVRDGETGLLVPERDPAALAAAMERIARDPALAARVAGEARRTVRERFDRRRNVARLAELFAVSTVRGGRPAPGAPGPDDRAGPGARTISAASAFAGAPSARAAGASPPPGSGT
jgi:colanic acid/amylovoran biosynthesis glycosyltransferase